MKELSLKEIQKASLEILKEVDQICKKEGIQYFLMYGTLIGAIRHKGFIPWDDDLDIGMLRKDFDCFIQYFKKKYNGHLVLRTREDTEGYTFGIPRVCNPNYQYVSTVKTYNNKDGINRKEEMGTFIDIYPIDELGDVAEYTRKLIRNCMWKNIQYSMFCDYKATTHLSSIPIRYVFNKYLHLVKGNDWNRFIDEDVFSIIKKYKNSESKYVGLAAWADNYIIYERQWFENLIDVEFEGDKYPIPQEYNKVLEREYGDYMKLPLPNDRKPHHDYKIFAD